MIKISFWLKRSDAEQGSLEYITIDSPKKVLEGKLVGMYTCEIYLSNKKELYPSCSTNPVETLRNASDFVNVYLQGLITRGFIISEVENREPWKLEKRDLQSILQEKIDAIKNNQDISPEEREKILSIIKESFGGSKSPIKDQINKLI